MAQIQVKRKTLPLHALVEVLGESEVEKIMTVMYGRRLLGQGGRRTPKLTREHYQRAIEVIDTGMVGAGSTKPGSAKYVTVLRRYFTVNERARVEFLNWAAGELEKLEPGNKIPRKRVSAKKRAAVEAEAAV